MTETNGTNGHPAHAPVAIEPRVHTRHLVVEIRDGDVVLSTEEPKVSEAIDWLKGQGVYAAGTYTAAVDKLPGRCGGSACIAGTRLQVSVLEGLARRGYGIEWILVNYPFITYEQFKAARTYASEHPEEIEAELREDEDESVELERDTEPPPPTETDLGQPGNPERDPRLTCRDGVVGKLPSERLQEIAREAFPNSVNWGKLDWPEVQGALVVIGRYLDERLGRAP